MQGTNLQGADLRGADMQWADMTGASLAAPPPRTEKSVEAMQQASAEQAKGLGESKGKGLGK